MVLAFENLQILSIYLNDNFTGYSMTNCLVLDLMYCKHDVTSEIDWCDLCGSICEVYLGNWTGNMFLEWYDIVFDGVFEIFN